ncbi:MAG: hypothetical protein ABIQ47_12215 [Tepidiformaceae bacterium]
MLADPQCPVVSPTANCPAKPIVATVAVKDVFGREIARITSGSDGSFRMPLPPGKYIISEVLLTPGKPASLKPETVTVVSGSFLHVALLFDTGIR